jgi:hypothetical protein
MSSDIQVVQLAGSSAPATYYPYGWYNKTTSEVDICWNLPASGDTAMVFLGFYGN